MMVCKDIDLQRSLRAVFGNRPGAEEQIETDYQRQYHTAEAILYRFLSHGSERTEMVILADEVGLGKTFVALTVAVSFLDMVRKSEAPDDLPVNKPSVLILTPSNDALYNKWKRETETFKKDCAGTDGALDWLTVDSPLTGNRSGNVIDLTNQIRYATKSQPRIIIAKMGVFGARLHDTDIWRKRALASVFNEFRIDAYSRGHLCRRILGSGSQANVPELLDLRRSRLLWEDTEIFSADLQKAYERALLDRELVTEFQQAIYAEDGDRLTDLLDDLTRLTLVRDWPSLPLVVIDEIHNLKNEATGTRRKLEKYLEGNACRLLGLSATPFQLHHEELLSVLRLIRIIDLSQERKESFDEKIKNLEEAMQAARCTGKEFREAWAAIRSVDSSSVNETWQRIESASKTDWLQIAQNAHPPRLARTFMKAVELEDCNRKLEKCLRPFVIRHRHNREYRRYWVGRNALTASHGATSNFIWAPGIEVDGNSELVHYLLMRAVSVAKNEKGLPGLGAELTGSYRHLVETSATWKRFGSTRNSMLPAYKEVLESCIARRESDQTHPKIQATVERSIKAFEKGQKSLIFCVYVKTAEAIRDELERRVRETLALRRDKVFGSDTRFEGFRRRFFNRREPLYSLIQDYPLLGVLPDKTIGVPEPLLFGEDILKQLAEFLIAEGEDPSIEKPDRRMVLAIVEHLAVQAWEQTDAGREWLDEVLHNCADIKGIISRGNWIPKRGILALAPRTRDPEAPKDIEDPILQEEADEAQEERKTKNDIDQIKAWVDRFKREPIGSVIAPFFHIGLLGVRQTNFLLPLLPRYHCKLLTQLDLRTRRAAGQAFRRILMAEEFLIRYLADAPREQAEFWADYLARRYTEPLDGHRESLRDRVHAYFETLVRAQTNEKLLEGYREAATNLNVVQLVKGGMDRDRYFLGFNTPYRPEILVSTSVGQEGIDLHRECRHVIHHDLCWNPATIEQRTGRVDRIGSKVERERAEPTDNPLPTLDIVIPYLAATYDERMFEELYRRAQLFEVTMGGDFRVEGRISTEEAEANGRRRKEAGVGSEDEDLGEEKETGTVDLPLGMVEQLRIDLSVWKPN